MPLIKRGRLSVQKVSQGVWPVIQSLAERGGWEDIPNTNGTGKGKGKGKGKTKATSSKRNTTTTRNREEGEEGDSDNREDRPSRRGPSKRKKERGVSEEKGSEEDEDGDGDLVQGRKKLKGSRLGTPDQVEGGVTTTARRSARLKR